MNREELIGLRKQIQKVIENGRAWPVEILSAQIVLVFEQAHTPTTPTDDEPSIEEVAEAFQHHEGAPWWQDDPVGRDAALRWHMRGFKDGLNARRTVQGEATDAVLDAALDAWFRAVDEGEYARDAMHAALRAAAATTTTNEGDTDD